MTWLKENWVGILCYSFYAALVPGAIWLFVGTIVDVATWFWSLPWSIKTPTYFIIGFLIQIYRPIKPSR